MLTPRRNNWTLEDFHDHCEFRIKARRAYQQLLAACVTSNENGAPVINERLIYPNGAEQLPPPPACIDINPAPRVNCFTRSINF